MPSTTHHIGRILALVALTAALAACSDESSEADAPESTAVAIETFMFSPDPVTVTAGTAVAFENLDSTTHTVTAGTRDAPEPDLFDAELGPGDSTAWTQADPGTYEYFCALHSGPGMTGQIIVE